MKKWKITSLSLTVLIVLVSLYAPSILKSIVAFRLEKIAHEQDYCWSVPRYYRNIAGSIELPIGQEYEPNLQSVWWNIIGKGDTRVQHFGIFVPSSGEEVRYQWEYRTMNFVLYGRYPRNSPTDFICQSDNTE